MTSIPRNDENIYRFDDIVAKEPEYSTLSYTWGRWRIKNDPKAPPALQIKNTPWPVPAVEETHFTPASFQNVVHKIQQNGVDWVWIDVGCIDQRRGAEQAAIEIGRQASIFKQAKSTFVWLSRLRSQPLGQAMDDIIEHGGRLYAYNHPTSVVIDLDDTMNKLQGAYDDVFSDPWFSSLWTLQEVVLRNDAMVLSAEGESVPWKVQRNDQRTYLTMLINQCQNDYRELEIVAAKKAMSPFDRPLSESTVTAIKHVMELILQAGFYYLFSTNPNVQYGTARHRTTSRNEDRIYAIMQIYNLSVGKSARPAESPSVAELVTEFAAAINRRSAILGQLFIHTAQPKPGYTWQITENSIVPDAFMLYREPVYRASIEFEKNVGCVAKGKCCLLSTLLGALEKAGRLDSALAVNEWALDFKIFLDSHIDDAASFRSPDRSHRLERSDPPTQIQCEDVVVLWLGDLRGSFSFRLDTYSRHHVGLLLSKSSMPEQSAVQGVPYYERLGIVTWNTTGDLHETPVREIMWQDEEMHLT